MENTVNQRVKIIIDKLYASNKRAFAMAIEVSPTVIENIVGTRQGNPSFEVTQKICAKANIEANWLLTGEGDMIKTSNSSVETVKEFVLKTDRREHVQQIPLYNLEAAAGLVQLFNNKQHVQEYISIPNLPKCDGAVYITGDSMYPLLKGGDIVMYKEVRDIVHGIFWGEMYLLTFEIAGDTYTMVKWLQRSEFGTDYIKLVSENQHHQPKDIPLSSIKAMAYIKASIRINSMT